MHADGSKADGFKSMVVAQFTGIGLQKDDNAFVKYDSFTRTYKDRISVSNIHTDSRAIFKPDYRNYHIKASNDAFIQLVSIFAIGYASHFVAESGGDLSITNSNSNFGAKSLVSTGYRKDSFPKDDTGYITHIIPPKELGKKEFSVEFLSVDVGLTTSISGGSATYNRLYLYQETNQDSLPLYISNGFKIGSKQNDILYSSIHLSGITSEYSCRITLPGTDVSSRKEFDVLRNGSLNSIQTNGTITLTEEHNFELGEKVLVFSEDGDLPDGIVHEKIYYVINNDANVNLLDTQIKLAETFENAFTDTSIFINNRGGKLKVISRVSDKIAGDVGHPIQWDGNNSNWYINVSTTENTLYNLIRNNGVSGLGEATQTTYVKRLKDDRSYKDKLYKFRYVIPKNSVISGRPPINGYVIQESNNTSLTSSENLYYYNNSTVSLNNNTILRNPGFISDATWGSNIATIKTELPHELSVGSKVEILNVKSGLNTTSEYNRGFNGIFEVISILNPRQFTYSLQNNPGNFQNNTTIRDDNLPRFSRKEFKETYQIYEAEEIQSYEPNIKDGIYYITPINSSNSPNILYFDEENYSQPIQNLYPQLDRDNPESDPSESICFASPEIIGEVFVNDSQKSITKETVGKFYKDFRVGFGITNIVSSTGTSHTIYTDIDHGFSKITSFSVVSSGSNYVQGTYYGVDLVGFAGSITGSSASARIIVNPSGQLSNLVIMDGGGNYGIGNTLRVIPSAGIGTTTGFTPAVIRVDSISDNIGDTFKVYGLREPFDGYNNLYNITGFSTSNPRLINVSSASSISSYSTSLIGISSSSNGWCIPTGKILTVSSFTYDSDLGVGIVTFSSNHGLNLHNKILLSGFDEDYFNQESVVTRVRSLETVEVDLGFNGSGLSTSGSIKVYSVNFDSFGGDITRNDENVGGRSFVQYDGITSYITSQLSRTSTSDQLIINNAVNLGFRIGDYLQVNNEIFRIRTTVTSNIVSVFRNLFGTKRQSHNALSIVRKIKVLPIELHRNSIIRASGHTFEYVGYGPGNYSTAFPERQDRSLTEREELLSQSIEDNGGVVFYTGMNDKGDFYTGNKKINSATGQEEVYDSPLPTIAGEVESPENIGADIISTTQLDVSNKIKVSGGKDRTILSEFEGPVSFNNKVINYSSEGFEAPSIFVQGNEDVAREFSIAKEKPDYSGNYGDVVTRTEPEEGGTIGWVYVTENKWVPWGYIGDVDFSVENLYFKDYIEGKITSSGIGTTSFNGDIEINVSVAATSLNTYNEIVARDDEGAFFTQLIGIGTAIIFSGKTNSVTGHGIGIGTTNPKAAIHIAGDGFGNNVANIYFDTRKTERQVIFDNGKTYAYLYGNTEDASNGESIGFKDFTNTRNIWYYRPPVNKIHIGLGNTGYFIVGDTEGNFPKVGIGTTIPNVAFETPYEGSFGRLAIGTTDFKYPFTLRAAEDFPKFVLYDNSPAINFIESDAPNNFKHWWLKVGECPIPVGKYRNEKEMYVQCVKGLWDGYNDDEFDVTGSGYIISIGRSDNMPGTSSPGIQYIRLTNGSDVTNTTDLTWLKLDNNIDGREIQIYDGGTDIETNYTIIRARSQSQNDKDNNYVFKTVVNNNPKIIFTSSGHGYWDGTGDSGGADYAEYFEWLDGNPSNEDRVGYTVVLENGKIRFADGLDNPDNILGVVSGFPSIVGDSAWSGWKGKWATDEFGRRLKKEVSCYYYYLENDDKLRSILVSDLPENFNIPENWTLGTIEVEYYSDDYNPNEEYIPREERSEWDAIGLLGKLRIRKGQPVGSRWIKLQDVSDNVELWLVK